MHPRVLLALAVLYHFGYLDSAFDSVKKRREKAKHD
jgi:hypothetical protein